MKYFLMSFIAATPLLLLSYLAGSVMSAIWIAKLFDLPDPRSYGSTNPGATNMARSNHRTAALMTFILDILKGVLTTWLAVQCGFSLQLAHLCGCCAVLGHIFPLYHNFIGGKGAATYFGVMLVLNSAVAGMAFCVWSLSLALFRNSGFSAVLTSCVTPFLVLANPSIAHLFTAVLAVNSLIIACHARNIEQLSQHLYKQLLSLTSS